MKEKEVKRAYDLAEKEIEEQKKKEHEKQVAEVKEIVKKTLLELENLKEQESSVKEKIKILKLDLDDLKAGKLERIKERQDKDPLAKKVSIIIIKEKETIREKEVPSPWYQPYTITWNTNTYPLDGNTVYCDNGTTYTDNSAALTMNCKTTDLNLVDCSYNTSVPKVAVFKLNNSVVKDNAIGTDKVAKKTIHFR